MVRALFLIVYFLATGLLLVQLLACSPSIDERYGESPFTADEASSLDLKIAVAPKNVAGEPRLMFTVSFVMPRERLVLKLPDVFLRKEKLYNRIEHLTVSPGGKLFPINKDHSILGLEHAKGGRVELKYLFRPDDAQDFQSPKESFSAAIIRDGYFQFVGLMALIFPIALIDAPAFSVTLDWQVPKNYQVYNSFGAEQLSQDIVTDFDKLRDAFFVAGQNLRAKKINVRNQPVYVTFEGEWDLISDDDFIDVVSRLLAIQRKTWNDDNFPYFLVNFLSVESDCNGNINFAGTAHPNSFRAFFPSGCQFIPDMRQLISHELMHMWIGKKIKVGKQRGHIDGKWFTEGFTDYYGRVLAERAGVLTEGEYFSSLNRQIEKYYTSRERLVSLKALVARMYRNGYSNKSLEEVPYQQGEIMAWRLNWRIKNASNFAHSLDDVIRDMLADANRNGGSKNFCVDDISAIVDRYVPHALEEEFSKVRDGKLLTLPSLPKCRMQGARLSSTTPLMLCSRWLE